jgi:3',5'-cyclic AMP phosphodiesterase CpdA
MIMPFTLPPISRRRFVASSFAAGAALAVRPLAAATRDSNPHVLALLSDTHIAGKAEAIELGANMTDHLRKTVGEVLKHPASPSAVIVNGDLALSNGQLDDYRQFAALVLPLRKAGLPVHVTMGNHDARDNFFAGVTEAKAAVSAIEGKVVTIVETPRANWFLLDALLRTLADAHGQLGETQLAWLAKALDERADKPAFVMVHQFPQRGRQGERPSGLIDDEALFKLLAPRKQVKAYINGHGHVWKTEKWDDIHVVHLPAVAYIFQKDQTSGWMIAEMHTDSLELTFQALDPQHKLHAEKVRLEYRT